MEAGTRCLVLSFKDLERKRRKLSKKGSVIPIPITWIYKMIRKLLKLSMMVFLFCGCSTLKDWLEPDEGEKPSQPPTPIEQPTPPQSTEQKLGCTSVKGLADGAGNNLWKPHSEGTGKVVILMPGRYHAAGFGLFNKDGVELASVNAGPGSGRGVIKRHRNGHNGDRDHIYIDYDRSAFEQHKPVYLRFALGAYQDCFTVAEPFQRND